MFFGAVQDKDGRMWFATRAGITVYNGLVWKHYDSGSGLPKNSYQKIKTDKQNIVWAVPRYLSNNIVYYKNNKWNLLPLINAASADSYWVNSFDVFYYNNEPVVCIGTNDGLFVYKDNSWKKITTANGLSDNIILTVTAHNSLCYIVTVKGISVYNGKSFDDSFNKILPAGKKGVVAVAFNKKEKDDGSIWLLAQKWIGFIKDGKLKIVTENIALRSKYTLENIMFEIGRQNNIYFGNRYAKYYLNIKTGKSRPLWIKNGFLSNAATSIFVDREDNVWFTDNRGIEKLNNFIFTNYYESSGLRSNEVSAFIEREPGEYIVGHNDGLTIMHNGEYKRIDIANYDEWIFKPIRILDLFKDKKGDVWIAASYRGLGRLDKYGKIKWENYFKDKIVTSALIDKTGRRWVSCDSGLYYALGTKYVQLKTSKKVRLPFRKTFDLGDGNFYVSGNYGAFCYSHGGLTKLFNSNIPAANDVFAMLKTDDGGILIGSADGLYIVKNNKFSKVVINKTSIDKPVYALTKDKNKNIYIGTNEGFFIWNGKETLREYGVSNGLSGNEINRSAFTFDSFGVLWIGTNLGLTKFSMENEKYAIPTPTIDLENLELVDGRTFTLTNDVNLNYNQNTFFLKFCGISFYDEKQIEYKIKLEGFDKDWLTVKQSQIGNIRYTNLPTGEYKLYVVARNQAGIWSAPAASGIISIAKPYYYSWQFILFACILEILIVYMVYKLFVLRVYNNNLKNQVNHKTQELRKSEYKLRLAYEELEQRVEERTIELAEANKKLRQYADEQKELNADKDKFFSIVAHDLKSPFQGLLGVSSILIEEYENLTGEQIKHFISVLRNSTKNIYSLIENLLQWSRLQTGRVSFDLENLNLFEETAYVQNLLSVNLSQKSIGFVNEIDENYYVFADKKMLHSILQNLGSNAIKFTKRGGTIIVSAKSLEAYIEITVKDNGNGISEEDLFKLFKINEQLSTIGTEEEEGTGLGLTICKEMIEKNKGSIRVESEVGKGSSFIFTLPIGSAEQ